MTKNKNDAKYAVTNVDYKLNRGEEQYIKEVKIWNRIKKGDSITYKDFKILPRIKVVDLIKKDIIIITATKNKNTEYWEKGEIIDIYLKNSKEYIKTNPNDEGKDNLGNLPKI